MHKEKLVSLKEPKVFDWYRAVDIIKERKASYAQAGLKEDFFFTGGDILRDGKPVSNEETYTHLASNWATPVIVIDEEQIPCYKMQHEVPLWDCYTYWPASALCRLYNIQNKNNVSNRNLSMGSYTFSVGILLVGVIRDYLQKQQFLNGSVSYIEGCGILERQFTIKAPHDILERIISDLIEWAKKINNTNL